MCQHNTVPFPGTLQRKGGCWRSRRCANQPGLVLDSWPSQNPVSDPHQKSQGRDLPSAAKNPTNTSGAQAHGSHFLYAIFSMGERLCWACYPYGLARYGGRSRRLPRCLMAQTFPHCQLLRDPPFLLLPLLFRYFIFAVTMYENVDNTRTLHAGKGRDQEKKERGILSSHLPGHAQPAVCSLATRHCLAVVRIKWVSAASLRYLGGRTDTPAAKGCITQSMTSRNILQVIHPSTVVRGLFATEPCSRSPHLVDLRIILVLS